MSEIDSVTRARTLLFVPGTRPDRFSKALAACADAIVLDLEDAVAPEAKAAARQHVRRWRMAGGPGLVRINDATTPWYAEDIAAVGTRPTVIMLPKVTTPAQVTDLLNRLPAGSAVLPILETAASVLDARAICTVPGVVRVAFGNGDLAAELGIDHRVHTALAYARSAVVLATAAAGIAPPVDGVTTEFTDDAALLADTRHAAELGFTGKMCIHPRQVPLVHRALTPSAADLDWARTVLSTADEQGVASVSGQMVDRPIIEHARRLLARDADHR